MRARSTRPFQTQQTGQRKISCFAWNDTSNRLDLEPLGLLGRTQLLSVRLASFRTVALLLQGNALTANFEDPWKAF
jgi:hypothetical protein